MFNHRLDEIPSRKVIWHWFLMCFNGGCINAGGFIATGKFVSHVTGFATLFGVDVVEEQFGAALGILSVPLFFLLGSFIAGLLIEREIHFNRRPRYDYVMGLCAMCLLVAFFGKELLGPFGHVELEPHYILLALLCLASGLQNAALSSSSARSVRTTHLTGLTTDLGIGLAKLLSFDFKKEHYQKELWTNQLRAGSIFSFVLGSAIAAFVFLKFEYRGFLLPALISSYGMWMGTKAKSALPD